jgi:predicted RNA-binding protein (virulence factor B family)
LIEIGKHHKLEIRRETSVGLFLGDESGEEVLLPNKYRPERFDIGDTIDVFVYRDNAERKIATTLTPDIELHEFALLKVFDITENGAFMEWGLEKHLFVPFSEQNQDMQAGKWYVIYLDLDQKTDRLYGSAKVEKHLSNEVITLREAEEVDLLIYKQTDLGYSVIVNNKYQGLIYGNEVYRDLRIGERLKGFVKKIREGNKLDISLQPIGFVKANKANTDIIYEALGLEDGFLPFTDKSPPEEIYARFAMSKKAFKNAIGALYKEKRIVIEEDGIRLSK